LVSAVSAPNWRATATSLPPRPTTRTSGDAPVASVPLAVEPSSERASAAVDRLPDVYVPRAFGGDAPVYVGGTPAEARDAFAVNAGWLPIVIGVVLTLSFVLLTLAFRSIAIPLTVGAAYGLLVRCSAASTSAGRGPATRPARSSTASPRPPA
jgi:uncharacterized membrane protein YdfJ with MMPL/SSD domain